MTANLRSSIIRAMAESEIEVHQPRVAAFGGYEMTYGHLAAVLAASVAAVALFASMILGWNYYLDAIGIHRTLRDVAIALYAFLLPSWFTVEEAWFSPKDPAKLESFRELQRKARLTWTIAAGAISIVIGITGSSGSPPPVRATNPPISVPSTPGGH
jgi:uncharacterized membrane protein YfcA